jgi:hypothetical protein
MPVPACGSKYARDGASSEVEVNPQARQSLLEGAVSPRARRNPFEEGVSPRARQNPLEGGVSPRARWNPLEGAFDWATLVGRGGHRGAGRALRVHLSKRCILFRFLQVLSRIPPVFWGTLRAVADRLNKSEMPESDLVTYLDLTF